MAHSLLSPSSASRWLKCTAAPRLEARFDDRDTDYTQEGTLAHAMAAMHLLSTLGRDYTAAQKEAEALKRHYTPEMEGHVRDYVDTVLAIYADAKTRTPDAIIRIEESIDLTAYAPECHGTADAVIIADGVMEVIDFKYGQGVAVSAVDNAQIMLYALGAYLAHCDAYDITLIRGRIIQPRKDNYSTVEIQPSVLLEWGTATVAPKAALAYSGLGAQKPGAWCAWCKAAGECRTLAALGETSVEHYGEGLMHPEAIAAKLPVAAIVEAWAKNLRERATQLAMAGTPIKGYKIVQGTSRRVVTDPKGLASALARAGHTVVWKPAELRGITELEKLCGKERFAQIAAPYLHKPEGKPTLVPESDRRPAIGGDFDNIN